MHVFQLHRQPFGPFEQLTVSHTCGTSMRIVPGHGAALLDLRFHNTPVLDGYETPEALVANQWAKSAFLFPFPNRLRDGLFHWQGRTYQFPVKESAGRNAIHGFSRNKPFELTDSRLTDTGAEITCTYRYRHQHRFFPFSFDVVVAFSLTPDTLTVDMTATNKGRRPMPFGMGWHPYFTLADTADHMSLQLPPCQRILVDDRMLPTGDRLPFHTFAQLRPLHDTALDTCFALTPPTDPAEILLTGAHGRLTYAQTGPCPFFQIFTPAHRRSVAIEPMTCNIDAFNNKEGLHILSPGGQLSIACRLTFTASD